MHNPMRAIRPVVRCSAVRCESISDRENRSWAVAIGAWRLAYTTQSWRHHAADLVEARNQAAQRVEVGAHVLAQVVAVRGTEGWRTQDARQQNAASSLEAPGVDVVVDHAHPVLEGTEAEVKVVAEVLELVDIGVEVEPVVVGVVDAVALARHDLHRERAEEELHIKDGLCKSTAWSGFDERVWSRDTEVVGWLRTNVLLKGLIRRIVEDVNELGEIAVVESLLGLRLVLTVLLIHDATSS